MVFGQENNVQLDNLSRLKVNAKFKAKERIQHLRQRGANSITYALKLVDTQLRNLPLHSRL